MVGVPHEKWGESGVAVLAEELVGALESIANGKTYINANISKKISQQFLSNEDNPLQQLSAREFEIFRLLGPRHSKPRASESSQISTFKPR